MEIPADLALLDRYASRRDPEAFTTLVRTYGGMVQAVCGRILGQGADRDDAVQETFLQLARQAGRVRSNLAGWLHAAARTNALGLLRSTRRRQRREDQVRAAVPDADNGEAAAIAERVDDCLAVLTTEERDLVVRHFLMGQPQVELAAALGLNQSTVARRLEKALARVRARFAAAGLCLVAPAVAGALSALPRPVLGEGAAQAAAKIGLAGVGPTAGGASLGIGTALVLGAGAALAAVAVWARPVAAPPIVPVAKPVQVGAAHPVAAPGLVALVSSHRPGAAPPRRLALGVEAGAIRIAAAGLAADEAATVLPDRLPQEGDLRLAASLRWSAGAGGRLDLGLLGAPDDLPQGIAVEPRNGPAAASVAVRLRSGRNVAVEIDYRREAGPTPATRVVVRVEGQVLLERRFAFTSRIPVLAFLAGGDLTVSGLSMTRLDTPAARGDDF